MGQRGIAQPITGIRGVRDQLAKEDLLLAVERVRDDIQQAAHLRLEASFFLRHGLALVADVSSGAPVGRTRPRYVAITSETQGAQGETGGMNPPVSMPGKGIGGTVRAQQPFAWSSERPTELPRKAP